MIRKELETKKAVSYRHCLEKRVLRGKQNSWGKGMLFHTDSNDD